MKTSYKKLLFLALSIIVVPVIPNVPVWSRAWTTSRNFVKNHPYLTAGLGITGLAGMAYGLHRHLHALNNTLNLKDLGTATLSEPNPYLFSKDFWNKHMWRTLKRNDNAELIASALISALEHGADVNCNWRFYGETPLMYAAVRGKEDLVKILIEHGADINCERKVFYNAESQIRLKVFEKTALQQCFAALRQVRLRMKQNDLFYNSENDIKTPRYDRSKDYDLKSRLGRIASILLSVSDEEIIDKYCEKAKLKNYKGSYRFVSALTTHRSFRERSRSNEMSTHFSLYCMANLHWVADHEDFERQFKVAFEKNEIEIVAYLKQQALQKLDESWFTKMLSMRNTTALKCVIPIAFEHGFIDHIEKCVAQHSCKAYRQEISDFIASEKMNFKEEVLFKESLESVL